MRQRERRAGVYQLILEIIKRVIEEKASKLQVKGYTTISSREMYKCCIEMMEEENRCMGVVTYAARLLNRYATRINSYRARWRITTDLLKKLYKVDESYGDLKDIPLHRLSNAQFLYVVASLLYEAKPEGDQSGYRD